MPDQLKISPDKIEVCPGDGNAFSVTPPTADVVWSVHPGVGKIGEDGIYTAPNWVLQQRRLVVMAKAGSQVDTAEITLNSGPDVVRILGLYGVVLALLVGVGLLLAWAALGAPSRIPMVIVNPPVVTLDPLKAETFTFSATVLGDAKNAVTWSATGNKSIDSSTGVYRHAATLGAPAETFTVKATSVSDPNRSATATVRLVPGMHFEALPQPVSAFAGQQTQFRMGDGSTVTWGLSRTDLGVISSDTGTFTVASGISELAAVQVSAWSVPPSQIVAAAAVVVNPPLGNTKAADWRVLAFAMVMGSLGSMLYFSSSFVTYVGNETFRATWFWFYISRPFVGGGLAVIFYFLIGAGMVGSATVLDLAQIGAISALVGLFSDKAVKKLSDVLDTLLATRDDRKDKISDPKVTGPSITASAPATLPKNAAGTLKLTGTRLTGVKVKVNARDAEAKSVSDTGFSVDVTAADTAGDKVTITATTSAGSATLDIKTVAPPPPGGGGAA